jgi:hemerythrin superfamily protein
MKPDMCLSPLLQQNHDALENCSRIRNGIKKNTDVAILKDFASTYWNKDLELHIQAEEEALLPKLEKFSFSPHYLHMIRRDHDLIRTLIERIGVDGHEHKVYDVLASLVQYHVFFEERVLFPKVNEVLNEQQLQELGNSLLGYKIANNFSGYPVKFWE